MIHIDKNGDNNMCGTVEELLNDLSNISSALFTSFSQSAGPRIAEALITHAVKEGIKHRPTCFTEINMPNI